jgi:hypothetical protein
MWKNKNPELQNRDSYISKTFDKNMFLQKDRLYLSLLLDFLMKYDLDLEIWPNQTGKPWQELATHWCVE